MQIIDGRKGFYQWDKDQKITSGDFSLNDEVHFWDFCMPEAITTKVKEMDGYLVAEVPNRLLQNFGTIVAYHYIYDDDSGDHTIKKQEFAICERPKPSTYVYTETEIFDYNSLDKRILALEQGSGGGVTVIVDQTYKPQSPYAQSGKAVAEAIAPMRNDIDNATSVWYASKPFYEEIGSDYAEGEGHTVITVNQLIKVGDKLEIKLVEDSGYAEHVAYFEVIDDLNLVKITNYDTIDLSAYLYDETDIAIEHTPEVLGKIFVSKLSYNLLPDEYTPNSVTEAITELRGVTSELQGVIGGVETTLQMINDGGIV